LKYFLLGAFSSAFFLFGSALLYGYSGSLDLSVIAQAIGTRSGMDGLLVPGVLLVLVGLLFKIGAVPFHSWTPDVYQGAPTPVTGFMGRLHQGCGIRCDPAIHLASVSRAAAGTGRQGCGRSPS